MEKGCQNSDSNSAEEFNSLLERLAAAGVVQLDAEGKLAAVVDADSALRDLREATKAALPDAEDDTAAQEEIILCHVLDSRANQVDRWNRLRMALGLQFNQDVPEFIWSTPESRLIAHEIDQVFLGRRDVRVLNGRALIEQFAALAEGNRLRGSLQQLTTLVQRYQANGRGWTANDFEVAVELLRSKRGRSLLRRLNAQIERLLRADRPVEEVVADVVAQAKAAEDLVAGRLAPEREFASREAGFSLLRRSLREDLAPVVSTGIPAFDLGLHGGVSRSKRALHVIGARPGTGKTQAAIHLWNSLALGGLHTLLVSTEEDASTLEPRAKSCLAHLVFEQVCDDLSIEAIPGSVSEPIVRDYRARRDAVTDLFSHCGGEDGFWDTLALAIELASAGEIGNPGNERFEQVLHDSALLMEGPPYELNDWRLRGGYGRRLTDREDLLLQALEVHPVVRGAAPQGFLYAGGMNVDEVRQQVVAYKSRHPGLAVVMLDHFHDLSPTPGRWHSERAEFGERAMRLKALTHEVGVTVFVAAQLRKGVDKETGPSLSDITETDRLGTLATCAWLLDFSLRKEPDPENASRQILVREPGRIVVYHAKRRNGQLRILPTGRCESASVDWSRCVIYRRFNALGATLEER